MCTENQNDIPIRTVVVEQDGTWTAHCVDFGLQARGEQPDEAVDKLEEAISAHLKRARSGETALFCVPDAEALKLYQKVAESKLFASGPGHGHVEHRPILMESMVATSL